MKPIESGQSSTDAIELVRKSARGDFSAFRTLMRKYQPYATAIAYRLLADEDDAKDIVQEAFVRVWNHVADYRPDVKFTTWLYKIVMNLCYDKIKMKKRRNSLFAFFSERTNVAEAADSLDIHEELEQRDLLKHIFTVARRLPPMERLVFQLRDVEDFSVDEVSEIAGISTGSVKTNLCNARKRIRIAMEKIQHREEQ